jgi:hypothetical protein
MKVVASEVACALTQMPIERHWNIATAVRRLHKVGDKMLTLRKNHQSAEESESWLVVCKGEIEI